MEVVMGPGFLGVLSPCGSKRSRPGPEDPSVWMGMDFGNCGSLKAGHTEWFPASGTSLPNVSGLKWGTWFFLFSMQEGR